ncbi:nuclear transport factor 2 family protein [Acerihabitans sp. KWT182]|uniref:Nuclear transport factor 2 family protein n=1 Tax=Acerihabitans sp. KWT182 TaxID=3157919 RepID=A0AAU7Q746_9GAMM
MSTISRLPLWFASAIDALRAGDTDGYMKMYAPDAVHEFPFAPEGGVRRLEGRDMIAAYMRKLPEIIRFGSLSDIRVRETGNEVIIEATGHHHRLADNAPRELNYVWFITLREGLVTHFRDYMNPLQLSEM